MLGWDSEGEGERQKWTAGRTTPARQACPWLTSYPSLSWKPRQLGLHPLKPLSLDQNSQPKLEERMFLRPEVELGRDRRDPDWGSARAQGRHSPGVPHLGSTWPGSGPASAPALWSGRCAERGCWPGPQPCARGLAWLWGASGSAGVLEQALGEIW